MRIGFGISFLSLSLSSLLSSPVLAETAAPQPTETVAPAPIVHHRSHHYATHRYHHFRPTAPCLVCVHPASNIILKNLTQNIGRALPSLCEQGWWWDCIRLSGGVNVDFGKWGNREANNRLLFPYRLQGYTGENTKHASVNDAYLNITARINNWVWAFTSLSYIYASNFYSVAYQTAPDSLDFFNNNNRFNVQQAYFHIGNFDESPVFMEFGQQFQDFGRYALHPITEPMTQSLTETLRTSIKLGYIDDYGFYGSVAAFQTPVPKTVFGHLSFNYIGALGFKWHCCNSELDIGGSYMYDFQGVNLIGNTAAFRAGVPGAFGIYHKRVNGVAFYADIKVYPVGLSLRYVGTPQRMSPLDLPIDHTNLTLGAKPWAASGQGNIGFRLFGLEQNIYLGYQASRETVLLNLPRSRYVVGYNALLCKNTTFSAEFDHDMAYPYAEGGARQNSNLVSLRIAVTFD